MIQRPAGSMDVKSASLMNKFNNILEDVIAGDRRSHFLKVDIDLNNRFFDNIGYLTEAGKTEYWHLINREMKDFDRGKTELKPLKRELTAEQQVQPKPFGLPHFS